MLKTAGLIAVIALLPGAVAYRLPIANRPRRAALPFEERAFWAVMISVAISTTAAFALAAAGAYTLERLAFANVLLSLGMAAASGGNLRLGAGAPRPGWTAAIPAALIAGGMWMYFAVPASEYVIGGRDPGVYVNEGIQIAQRQSLVTVDRLAADVPEEFHPLFFPQSRQEGYYSVRFMGFHLRDARTGEVSGQFPQTYPVWIAIGYGLDGLTGARRTAGWWAILGVLAVYFAARRLIGPWAAAAAAGLLCVHAIQTWYARYPNSEIVTQALLFAALLAHAYAHEEDDAYFGPIAASLVGLALFTRLPVIIAVGTAVVASILAPAGGRGVRAGFLVTLAIWLGAAGWYYTTQLRPYFNRPVTFVNTLQPFHLALLAAAGVAVCALLVAIRRPAVAAATRTWLPRVLAGAVVAAGLYALFFRQPGGRLAPHDAFAVRVFADFYFTRVAFLIALAGCALVVWRSFWRAPAMLLTLTVLSGFFFYKMRIWPEHFWLARRFLTEILPASAIFTAAVFFAPAWWTPSHEADASRARNWRALFVALGFAAAAVLGQIYASQAWPLRHHVEYAGIIPRLERMAGGFSDDDLVLFESRAASDVHTLALPQAYIYARNVLVLYEPRPDKLLVRRFLDWAGERYQTIYFVAGGGTDLLSPGVTASVVSTERFQVPEYQKTAYDTYPVRTVMKPFDYTIYRLAVAASAPAPQSLDIGGTDDLHLVDFHPKERLGGGDLTFRWSRDRSSLLMRVMPDSRELVLRLSGGRPRGVPPPAVTAYLDGVELCRVDPSNEFREYAFPIPPQLAAAAGARPEPADIRIDSSTWVPRTVLGGSDTRPLGVMVDRAEIR